MGARHRNGRFFNVDPTDHAGAGTIAKWMLRRDRGPWRNIDAPPGPPPPARVTEGIRVTMVGHATVLIQCAGLNLLTDPHFSQRASPVSWAGPKRMRPPGLRFEDLPPIDWVLISHNHYDHLDVPTLRRLARAGTPKVMTGLGNGPLIERTGLSGVHEVDWWDELELGDGVYATAVPARHFSGRTLRDRDRTLWMGMVIRCAAGQVLFAGDTGMGSHFAQIRDELGPVDLALLPIGAFRPRWVMQGVHTSPADAVEAHRLLGATTSVPIHYGVFPMADDGMDEPLEALQTALERSPSPHPAFEILAPGDGQTFDFGRADPKRAIL